MSRQYDGGVWTIDDAGDLHLDIRKMLARLNIEDSPENRGLALLTMLEIYREVIPDIVALAVIGIVPRRWGWDHE